MAFDPARAGEYDAAADAHRASGPSYADLAARLQAARDELAVATAAAADAASVGAAASAGGGAAAAVPEDGGGVGGTTGGPPAKAGKGSRRAPQPRSDRVGNMPFDKW